MRDQKIPAHDPKHEFSGDTEVKKGDFFCQACGKDGEGAFLATWAPDRGNLQPIDICRACIRLALWRMA